MSEIIFPLGSLSSTKAPNLYLKLRDVVDTLLLNDLPQELKKFNKLRTPKTS